MLKMSIDRPGLIKPGGPLVRSALNGPTMGTRYSAVFYARPGTEIQALATALFEAVGRVDQQMSTFKPGSALNQLNAAPIGEWIELPRELLRVLDEATQIGRASAGAFDIGVGDLVAAWGFGAPVLRPDRDTGHKLNEQLRPDSFALLELDIVERKARRIAPVTLDLSGIAKGFGVDEMARVMHRFSIPAWLVGIDGEMRAKGSKPGGEPWLIAQERPNRNIREAMAVIELKDMAVATSGNYRHCVDVDGKLISHIMNAKSGKPLDNMVASVTVLAPNCMAADAWATAFMVLGADAGRQMAVSLGMNVIFVLNNGDIISTM